MFFQVIVDGLDIFHAYGHTVPFEAVRCWTVVVALMAQAGVVGWSLISLG